MALIKCTECGKEFSDKAPACPNCGCPTSAQKITTPNKNSVKTFDDAFISGKALKIVNIESYNKTKSMIGTGENVLLSFCANLSTIPRVKKPTARLKDKEASVIAITDRRIIACRQMAGIGSMKEMYFSQIESIDTANTIFASQIRIVGLTEMFVIDCNSKLQKQIMETINSCK